MGGRLIKSTSAFRLGEGEGQWIVTGGFVKEQDAFRGVRTNDTTQHVCNVRYGIHYEIAECYPQFAMKIPIFTGLTNSLLIIFAVYSPLRWREDYHRWS